MSVPASGGVPTGGAGEEAIELPAHGDAAFASLMDALAPEPDETQAGAAAGEAGTGASTAPAGGADAGSGGDGQAGLPTAGDAGAAGAPGAGAERGTAVAGGEGGADAGAAGGDPGQPAAAGGADARPAAWTASAADLVPKLGELSTKLEETTLRAYQNEAFEEVKTEHANYFEALNKHPRLLVGTEVPAIGREGMERLKDTADAREWQEAVKSLLIEEVNDRAGRAVEENRDFLETLHASVDLFKNNVDLVPGTKDFDVELANRFAQLAKPYELRVDEKLQGYSIPVQPIIDNLRAQIQKERTTRPAVQTPASTTAPAGQAKPKPDPPQAGIPSKAGNSGDKEDFSTLFGTIGLPNLQI